MTLPLWPASPLPQLPYAWKMTRRVKRGGPFGGDRWLTRADNRFALFSVGLTYFVDDFEELRPVLDFWESVGGPNGVFDFKDLNVNDGGGIMWKLPYVGQIAAATVDYELPIASSTGTGFVLTLDGVAQTVQRIDDDADFPPAEDGTSDIYLHLKAATNGRDKAVTRVQQTVGAIIGIEAMGFRFMQARVLEEELPIVWTENTNYTLGPVTLTEVR
ncbi:MAG: hypothetical protein PHS14_17390 [Elusimicrobia bacterium]|nr:hypothetical protein [Elusimicrobiota bacterium]